MKYFLLILFSSIAFGASIQTLQDGRGGTGLTGGTGILYFSSGSGHIAVSGSINPNGLLYGNGLQGPTSTSAATDGQMIVGQTSSAPLWKSMSGDSTIDNLGVLTLATSGVTAGTFGSSATSHPNIVVDAKGRITSASNTTIALATSAITSGSFSVARGGTGNNTLTNHGVLLGQGTGAIVGVTMGDGSVLVGNVSGDPTAVGFSGDISSVSNAGVVSLSSTGVTAGTYGSAATSHPNIVVDAKGRITSASNTTIAIAGSAITSGTVSEARGGLAAFNVDSVQFTGASVQTACTGTCVMQLNTNSFLTSVTRAATGKYDLNFASASTASFSQCTCNGVGGATSATCFADDQQSTTGHTRIHCETTANVDVDAWVNCICHVAR